MQVAESGSRPGRRELSAEHANAAEESEVKTLASPASEQGQKSAARAEDLMEGQLQNLVFLKTERFRAP